MKALVKCSAAVASLGAATLCLFLSPTASSADSGLIASDGGEYQAFGEAVFIRGSFGFVGAPFADGHGPGTGTGLAYLFRDLETDSGPMTETVKLVAGSRENAISVSLWGNMGIVGARSGWGEGGAAYVYRDLDTVAGSSNQNVDNSVAPSAKLTPLDGHLQDQFGESVSLWGTAGLVGAPYAVSPTGGEGAAYLFRNLDTATGTITESVRLAASDGGNQFGQAVSLTGNLGLVGAYTDSEQTGAAYVFRNLDTATGTVTEDVRLTASDGANYDWFGYAVSVDGNIGLVGAHNADSGSREDSGAAYVFRDLDVAAGTVTEAVKLTASDIADYSQFGYSVSLSGGAALVGAPTAPNHDEETFTGAAYLFRDVDAASGVITETVKLTASEGEDWNYFGVSVSIDGDRFLIGESGRDDGAGKVHSGSVSAVTTLDEGDASRIIAGFSFVSSEDWIVGETTSGNSVRLSAGDSADVTAEERAVYIGKEEGASGNTLWIDGYLAANEVIVGTSAGTADNLLLFSSSASFDIGSIYLGRGSLLGFEGDYAGDIGLLFSALGDTSLFVYSARDGDWTEVDPGNHDLFVDRDFDGTYTFVSPVVIPEPATAAVFVSVFALAVSRLLRRSRRKN